MRVLVTGGTGFVGRVITQKLLERGHEVRGLVRRGSERKLSDPTRIEPAHGDLFDTIALPHAVQGCDAVIHLVGIIREYPSRGITFERIHLEGSRRIIAAAKQAGVRRFLHMSALGTRPNARSRYHQTKHRAEAYLKESGLAYTIFRPAVIFGPEDQFVNMLAGLMKLPIVPVIGSGRNLMQPVSVENVADGFTLALERDDAIGKTFDVGGPESFPYRKMLEIIAEVLGRRPLYVPAPIWAMWLQAGLLQYFPWFPVSQQQLLMLQEDNVCDARPFFDFFKLTPIRFQDGIAHYLQKGAWPFFAAAPSSKKGPGPFSS